MNPTDGLTKGLTLDGRNFEFYRGGLTGSVGRLNILLDLLFSYQIFYAKTYGEGSSAPRRATVNFICVG